MTAGEVDTMETNLETVLTKLMIKITNYMSVFDSYYLRQVNLKADYNKEDERSRKEDSVHKRAVTEKIEVVLGFSVE